MEVAAGLPGTQGDYAARGRRESLSLLGRPALPANPVPAHGLTRLLQPGALHRAKVHPAGYWKSALLSNGNGHHAADRQSDSFNAVLAAWIFTMVAAVALLPALGALPWLRKGDQEQAG